MEKEESLARAFSDEIEIGLDFGNGVDPRVEGGHPCVAFEIAGDTNRVIDLAGLPRAVESGQRVDHLSGVVLGPIRFRAGEERLSYDGPGEYAVGQGGHVRNVLAVERPAIERRTAAGPCPGLVEVGGKDRQVGIGPGNLLDMVNALVISRHRSHLNIGPPGTDRVSGDEQPVFRVKIGGRASRVGRNCNRANQPVAQVNLTHCHPITMVGRAAAFPNGNVVRRGLRRPVQVGVVNGAVRHPPVFTDMVRMIVGNGHNEVKRVGPRLAVVLVTQQIAHHGFQVVHPFDSFGGIGGIDQQRAAGALEQVHGGTLGGIRIRYGNVWPRGVRKIVLDAPGTLPLSVSQHQKRGVLPPGILRRKAGSLGPTVRVLKFR